MYRLRCRSFETGSQMESTLPAPRVTTESGETLTRCCLEKSGAKRQTSLHVLAKQRVNLESSSSLVDNLREKAFQVKLPTLLHKYLVQRWLPTQHPGSTKAPLRESWLSMQMFGQGLMLTILIVLSSAPVTIRTQQSRNLYYNVFK